MTIKINIEDHSLVSDYLAQEKSQRTSGKGRLADSWIISSHLRSWSKNTLGQNIDSSNITGIHAYLTDKAAVISGVNFGNIKSLKNFEGKAFSLTYRDHSGSLITKNFRFKRFISSHRYPIALNQEGLVPLMVFFNSCVYEIDFVEGSHEDFYNAVTLNLELLKELGRDILPGGEPEMDFQLMDFESALPRMPDLIESEMLELIKKLKA